MSAKVLRLVHAHSRAPSRRWTNQDLAELYRISETLRRAGVDIDTEQGQTDEGDPWYCFCNRRTGDVLLHIAQVQDGYIAEIALLDRTLEANSFSDIVSQFLHAYPIVLPPASRDTAARVWMHPASGLAALVFTIYMLNDMVRPVSMSDDGSLVIDGQSSEVVTDDALEKGPAELAMREQLKAARLDPSSWGGENFRAAALAAALAIAAVVIDDRHADLADLLDHAGLSKLLSRSAADVDGERADHILLAELKAAAQQQLVREASAATEAGAVHTGYVAKDAKVEDGDITAELTDEFGLDGVDRAMLVDLATHDDRQINEIGHEFGAALAAFLTTFTPELGQGLTRDIALKSVQTGYATEGVDGEAREGIATVAAGGDTAISATHADGSLDVNSGPSGATGGEGSNGPRLGTNEFIDAIGLGAAPIVLASQSDVELFLSGLQQDQRAPTSLLVADAGPSTSQPVVSPAVIGARDTSSSSGSAADGMQDLFTAGGDRGSDTLGQPGVPSQGGASLNPQVPGTSGQGSSQGIRPNSTGDDAQAASPGRGVDVAATIAQSQLPASGGGIAPPLPFNALALDFSKFDAISVVRAFVDVVGDVGVMYYRDTFYIYDKSPDLNGDQAFEIETVRLADGDEVNLIGQPAAFQAVAEALI
ncbi:MAG: hypothetical protein NW217_15090 [Hyphomicrobiaceae bacterium]|nr:hypothetical protein [Hyphomicrobiaceae bacterium]